MPNHLSRVATVAINLVLCVVLSAGAAAPTQAQAPAPAATAETLMVRGQVVNAPAGARVQAARVDGTLAAGTYVGPVGQYAFPPLLPAAYHLQVVDASDQRLSLTADSQADVSPVCQAAPCEYVLTVVAPPIRPPAALGRAPTVVVDADTPQAIGDAAAKDAAAQAVVIQATGQITGVVKAADTDLPLPFVEVEVYDPAGDLKGTDYTAYGTGSYSIMGLATGLYTVHFIPPSWGTPAYAPKWYNNQGDRAHATSVSVTDGATKPNINAVLDIGGQVTGRVTAAVGGAPVENVSVYLYADRTASIYDPPVASAYTNASGVYTVTGLAAGDYYLKFSEADYLTTYYNNRASLADANAVNVKLNAVTDHIDAALNVGGKITGQVTAAAGGTPLQDVSVYAYTNTTSSIYDAAAYAYTNASGVYTFTDLAAGNYYVRFEANDYLPAYYNNQASLAAADAVSVTLNAVTAHVDAALNVGGKITGQVTAAVGGAPILGVQVRVYTSTTSNDYDYVAYQTTDAFGNYTVTGLAAGNYYVKFEPPYASGYLPQSYHNQPTLAAADAVSVTLNSVADHIDAALNVGGKITGQVTAAAGGAPISGVQVQVYTSTTSNDYDYVAYQTTDASGIYTVTKLAAGNYYVKFEPPYASDYLLQYYYNQSTLAAATAVSVTLNAVAGHIDAALNVGGKITGQVTAAVGGAPISGVQIKIYTSATSNDYDYVAYQTTNAAGVYTVTDLAAGTYYVKFDPAYNSDYFPQYYHNQSTLAEADAVSVALNTVRGSIDAALNAGGKITGRVTAAESNAPLPEVQVSIYALMCNRQTWTFVRSATTDAAGYYTATRLATGDYVAQFDPLRYGVSAAYLSEYYDDKTSMTTADTISVVVGQATENVDAALTLGGTLTGQVTDVDGGAPLEDVYAYVYGSQGNYVDYATTNASGAYTVTALPAGSYTVRFIPSASGTAAVYIPEYYNDKTTAATADPVDVPAGTVVHDIDAALARGGQFTGLVTAEDGGTPLEGAYVTAYDAQGMNWGMWTTNASGVYTSTGLAGGSYRLRFSPGYGSSQDYLSEYHIDKSSLAAADPVALTPPDVVAVDAILTRGGAISGTVTSSLTGAPLEVVTVIVLDGNGNEVKQTYTDSDGHYLARGLPTGDVYHVHFLKSIYANCAWITYEIYYQQKIDLNAADHVSVTAPDVTPDIDGQLPIPGMVTLNQVCLPLIQR